MHKFIRKTSIILSLGGSLSLLATSAAYANHYWTDSTGTIKYHWKRSGALTLDIGDNVSGAWGTSLVNAISDWNGTDQDWQTPSHPDGEHAVFLTKKRGKSNLLCGAVKGTVQVCNAQYGATGWLGIASIWLESDGHIKQGVTKLNDYYYSPSYSGGFYDTSAWRAFVTCQEIGHTFGLAHQDEDFNNANLDTCMDYTLDPSSNQSPNGHDYELLQDIYIDHSDTMTKTVGGGGGGNKGGGGKGKPALPGENSVGNSQADWGRAVHFQADGRPDMFVRTLPSGNKQVTHVFWVPGQEHAH